VIRIILSLFFILSAFYPNVFAHGFPKEKPEEIELNRILEKAGQYCERLNHSAFNYVCLEEVSEKIDISRDTFLIHLLPRGFKKKQENRYLYDYQLIRKDYKTKERRILLEENGKKKNGKDGQLKTTMFQYEKVLFGPIDLLSKYRQRYYDYKIVGKEILNGDESVVIKAAPKAHIKQRYFSGKIWLKKSKFTILRIELNPKSIGNFQILEGIAKRYKAEPKITLISEYKIEKNGIQFPSRYFIEEAYINNKGKKFIRSEINVIYRDYKFFIVETEVKY